MRLGDELKRKQVVLELEGGQLVRLDYEDFLEIDPIIIPVELYNEIHHVGKFYKKKHGVTYKKHNGIRPSKGFVRTKINNLVVYGFDESDSKLSKPLEVWKQII